MIPLLPPLVEFMDPTSLCHYSGTSKTLRKEVRDTKAWALLARAQLPRKTRDEASEALSHVKSHVRRRLLADALSQDTPPPVAFRPNGLQDFTFFVRFEEEEGRKIWEGDLKAEPGPQVWIDYSESAWFDLGPVGWTFIRNRGLKFTVVAIRDEDNAMVSLGQFNSRNCDSIVGSDDETEVEYSFQSRTALFSSARFNLRLCATLVMVCDAEGRDSVSALSLRLEHHSEYAVDNHDHTTLAYNPDGHVDTFSKSQLEYLLSYLAGIHHLARAPALATIESWHVDALRYIIQRFEELRP
jgi:hypothetical protein